jgi:D-psicose/D-tagatose/L-ribulose 3-epimerase
MKLSISNIAWPFEEDKFFLSNIKKWGCSGVEIAPNKIWMEPVNSKKSERDSYRKLVGDYDLEISALHALLYNRQDLGLFKGKKIEEETIDYLKSLCYLASDLGANILIFGSPKNRIRGNIAVEDAFEKASLFFSKVAETAEELSVCICIEPLGNKETDFINTSKEGLKLVKMVNSPGFGLHLDAKAISEENDDFLNILSPIKDRIKHFHINDPNLTEINSTGLVDHASLGKALRNIDYKGYVSIEMRTLPDHYNVIKRSLRTVKEFYSN